LLDLKFYAHVYDSVKWPVLMSRPICGLPDPQCLTTAPPVLLVCCFRFCVAGALGKVSFGRIGGCSRPPKRRRDGAQIGLGRLPAGVRRDGRDGVGRGASAVPAFCSLAVAAVASRSSLLGGAWLGPSACWRMPRWRRVCPCAAGWGWVCRPVGGCRCGALLFAAVAAVRGGGDMGGRPVGGRRRGRACVGPLGGAIVAVGQVAVAAVTARL